MSINCIALGKRICFYRLKFNITQEKLAALTNCSREYIAYLESGTKTPSLPTLIDLANVLHISVDDLLDIGIIVEWGLPFLPIAAIIESDDRGFVNAGFFGPGEDEAERLVNAWKEIEDMYSEYWKDEEE